MNDSNRRSFWSSVPGLVTGAAGVLTAVVGLFTVLIQLDVIGKDADNGTDATVPGASTVTQPGATAPGGAPGGTTAKFTVTPPSATFDTVLKKEAKVTVSNDGSVPLDITTQFAGADPDKFKVDAKDCTSAAVSSQAKCTMTVTYVPSTAGQHAARLIVAVAGAASPQEVKLSGSRPL